MTARIPLHEITVSNIVFPSTAEMWSLCYALQMDRLTLTVWTWLWTKGSYKTIVLSTMMGLCSWSLFSFPELWRHIPCREQLCLTIAKRDTAVASVEPETGRQDDSSAIVTDVRAGVHKRLSVQGHEESKWDGGREECVFCFCSLCVTNVGQQWLGHGQSAHKRNSRNRKKLFRKFWSMLNTHRAWQHPLYVRKKAITICWDHADEIVVHVLREIMPEYVLKLVRGLYPNLPDTPYLRHKWC